MSPHVHDDLILAAHFSSVKGSELVPIRRSGRLPDPHRPLWWTISERKRILAITEMVLAKLQAATGFIMVNLYK